MFILKNLLTPFLLPPGIFIITLIFTGFWLLHKKNKKAGIATLVFGCIMWALSIAPVSDAMISVLESKYSIPKNITGDVIILLSSSSNDYPIKILKVVRLQKTLDVAIIVSGKTSKIKNTNTSIFIRLLLDLGVPAEKIIEEDKSRDTFENAEFTKEICVKQGFTNPILVTSAFHMKRAVISFEKAGLEITPFPATFIYSKDKQYEWDAYLPGHYLPASIALKEYLGILFYKIAY